MKILQSGEVILSTSEAILKFTEGETWKKIANGFRFSSKTIHEVSGRQNTSLSSRFSVGRSESQIPTEGFHALGERKEEWPPTSTKRDGIYETAFVKNRGLVSGAELMLEHEDQSWTCGC
jgi:hypothetical protein